MPLKQPTIPRVPLNGRGAPEEIRIPGVDYPTTVFEVETPVLAEETAEAAAIAADAEVTIPIMLGGLILLGVLYSARYLLVPLLKLIKIPGANWFSDLLNNIIGFITAPIQSFFQGIMHQIALGIEAHAVPITRVLESGAWAIHDLSIELANYAASNTEATSEVVTTVIPRVVEAEVAPVRKRVNDVYADITAYNAIAKRNGFTNFRALLTVETPRITELRKAEAYVKGQGHASLAGALSTFQTTTNRVDTYEHTVRKLGYFTLPTWITHITTEITKTVPETIRKLALRVGKIELKIKPNKLGIPNLMAVMAPAAIAAWFRPAIPKVCTDVGECAANNILGRSNWQWLKDFLSLILAAAIDALLLTDICAISRLAATIAQDFEPELRALVVVEGGLASIGCAGSGHTLAPPAY